MLNTRTAPPHLIRHRRAHNLLLLAVLTVIVTSVVGGTWDALYHATVPFDGFFSPPHVFVYACGGFAALILYGLMFIGRLRPAFEGPSLDVRLLPFRVPASLILMVGGITLLGFAGLVLDNAWHTAFGLNETSWSFPHAMLAWSILLLSLGYVAARQDLQMHKPIRWYTVLLMGTLVMACSAAAVLGPFGGNRTPTTQAVLAQLPGLLAQPPAQHVFRIVETYNLTRTNPVFLLVSALWLGATLAFLVRLDDRWWLTLALVLLWALSDDAQRNMRFLFDIYATPLATRDYAALPILLPVALWLLLRRLRVGLRVNVWGLGLTLATLVQAQYGDASTAWGWLLVPLAAPVAWWGWRLGEAVYARVAQPSSWGRVAPLLLMVLAVPLLTGLLDLALRATVPFPTP